MARKPVRRTGDVLSTPGTQPAKGSPHSILPDVEAASVANLQEDTRTQTPRPLDPRQKEPGSLWKPGSNAVIQLSGTCGRRQHRPPYVQNDRLRGTLRALAAQQLWAATRLYARCTVSSKLTVRRPYRPDKHSSAAGCTPTGSKPTLHWPKLRSKHRYRTDYRQAGPWL